MSHKTPLFQSHKNLKARIIDFAGWHLPFCYTSPGEEHLNTRKSGGLFDVSHMGEFRVKGKGSLSFLQNLLPTDIQNLETGQARYSVFCSRKGGLIDDLIIYALSRGEEYLLCVNAATREKDWLWLQSFSSGADVKMIDESAEWGMVAVQGPQSLDLCERVFSGSGVDFRSLRRFHFAWAGNILISRTGYTGEEGVELYIPWEKTLETWEILVEQGRELSIGPVGLGARNTLRLEMAYLLSGQDFNESHTPLEAGLSRLMTNKGDYVGKKELEKSSVSEKLSGFIVEEPSGIPRTGHPVLSGQGEPVGVVTSGAQSPSLEKMIGLAYIKEEAGDCFVNIHGSSSKITRVSGPFLKNPGKGAIHE